MDVDLHYHVEMPAVTVQTLWTNRRYGGRREGEPLVNNVTESRRVPKGRAVSVSLDPDESECRPVVIVRNYSGGPSIEVCQGLVYQLVKSLEVEGGVEIWDYSSNGHRVRVKVG